MAPMGQYLKFTFDAFFYKYAIPNQGILFDYYSYYGEENELANQPQNGKSKLFAFKAEYGYDFFVLNCLKLSMGVSLGTTFGGYKAINREKYDHTVIDYADNRLLNAYWFGIKLGVGFLTF